MPTAAGRSLGLKRIGIASIEPRPSEVNRHGFSSAVGGWRLRSGKKVVSAAIFFPAVLAKRDSVADAKVW